MYEIVVLVGCYHKENLKIDGMDFGIDLAIGVIDKVYAAMDGEEEGLLGIGTYNRQYEDNFLWKYYDQLSNEQREKAMIGFGVRCEPGQSNRSGLFSIGMQITEFSTQEHGTDRMPKKPVATVLYEMKRVAWANVS